MSKRPTTWAWPELEDFVFGNVGSSTTAALNEFQSELDMEGKMAATLLTDFDTDPSRLYEVSIDGTIFDVGGRANTAREYPTGYNKQLRRHQERL